MAQEREETARTVKCSACGAEPGQPCRRIGVHVSRSPMPAAHQSRYEAAARLHEVAETGT
jgi:hypothetical protein